MRSSGRICVNICADGSFWRMRSCMIGKARESGLKRKTNTYVDGLRIVVTNDEVDVGCIKEGKLILDEF